MKKKDILVIGCGQAGGNLVDELLSLDSRYNGLFINTSVRDVKGLKNAKLDRNVYLIPNTDGSGRNRAVGISYVKDNALAIIDTIASYVQQNEVILVSSCGGGSGSSIVPAILRLAKKRLPNKRLHVVAIKPSLEEQTDVLENSIGYWNDVMGAIDAFETFSIVDNDKRKDRMDINKEWAHLMDSSLNIANGDIQGSIDDADLKVMSTAKGYKVIYNLDLSHKIDEKMAVGKAINESIFFDAPSSKCSYLGISLKRGDYNGEKIRDQFEVSRSSYIGINESENIVMATGCEIPRMAIDLIIEELEERKKNNSAEVIFDKNELKVEVERSVNKKEVVEVVEQKFTSNEEVIDEDDDFWGDAF